MSQITLDRLQKALDSLEKGYKPNPGELERDGIIQRFEFSVEMCWKTAQRVLAANGVATDVPKSVFRELAKAGWINDHELWFKFIDARNKASHIYSEQMAGEVYNPIGDFISESKALFSTLQQKVK